MGAFHVRSRSDVRCSPGQTIRLQPLVEHTDTVLLALNGFAKMFATLRELIASFCSREVNSWSDG